MPSPLEDLDELTLRCRDEKARLYIADAQAPKPPPAAAPTPTTRSDSNQGGGGAAGSAMLAMLAALAWFRRRAQRLAHGIEIEDQRMR